MPTTETAVRAELYVRETLPTPARRCSQAIIARLERLTADGYLEDYSVQSWAKRLAVQGAKQTEQRDRYNAFSQWARADGVRLQPFFHTRECYSMNSGEKRTELVFPAICLVVYEDDEVSSVAPHATESGNVTVNDALDRFRDQRDDDQAQQTTLTAG